MVGDEEGEEAAGIPSRKDEGHVRGKIYQGTILKVIITRKKTKKFNRSFCAHEGFV
jgi:hypothetical protein